MKSLLNGVFSEDLLKSGKRLTPSSIPVNIKLDRNESAFDVEKGVKADVINALEQAEWNKYPPPYFNELEELIAKYCGVKRDQVVPGAGSANIISSILNYFAIRGKQVVLAHPSFSLYEYHCNSYGISYDLWKLNEKLEYDIKLLPELKPFSLVLFASPNNPVGNTLDQNTLEELLVTYPETIFLMDEVYDEFCDGDSATLIDKYPNLLLLRSFSKTFSSAGLRIGYLIANEEIASNIRKLILPFVLNCLSTSFVKAMLSNESAIAQNKANIEKTILERERVFMELQAIDPILEYFTITPSQGNFLLVRFKSISISDTLNRNLEENGIKLLDLSNIKMLAPALRLTIGKPSENNSVIEVFKNSI